MLAVRVMGWLDQVPGLMAVAVNVCDAPLSRSKLLLGGAIGQLSGPLTLTLPDSSCGLTLCTVTFRVADWPGCTVFGLTLNAVIVIGGDDAVTAGADVTVAVPASVE